MAFKSTRASRRLKNNRSEDQKQSQPFFTKTSDTVQTKQENAFFQAKLTIGQPNDKYEKEADAVADSVVNKTDQQTAIQQKEISSIQCTSLATPMEDEKLGTAEKRMEEDKLIQEKPDLQKMDQEEDEVQMKSETAEERMEEDKLIQEKPDIQKMDQEEEEVQMKSETSGGNTASAQLSQKISSKAGNGQKMSPKVRAEMESGIGADFGGVNIHTDSEAVQMNKELGAQAFTHGNDVFFNEGKYRTESTEGKKLLAHELTHVVQQKGQLKIQEKKDNDCCEDLNVTEKFKELMKSLSKDEILNSLGSIIPIHNNDGSFCCCITICRIRSVDLDFGQYFDERSDKFECDCPEEIYLELDYGFGVSSITATFWIQQIESSFCAI